MRNKIIATAVAAVCLASVSAHAAGESTTINGLALIDLTNLDTTTTTKATGASADSASNGIGLDVTRFYVGINHTFDDTWSANVTTDFQYSSAVSATEVFIKKAYLQAKFSDAFTLRAGSADMPWIPFAEGIYGYRYVAKTVNDLEGTANPADWGVHALGTFGNGVVSYAVSAVNGGGYKNPTRSKNVDFEGRISVVPVKGLTVAVGFYNGKRGKETALDTAENTFSRFNALVGYVSDKFRVGAEYYTLKNLNSVQQNTAPVDTDKADAYSVWASFNFTPVASVFARYDDQKINPNDTTNSSHENTNKYLHIGVGFQPRKNIDLALVYKNTKTDTNFAATSAKTDEIGVFSQVKF